MYSIVFFYGTQETFVVIFVSLRSRFATVRSLSKLRLLDFWPLYLTYVLGVNDMNVPLFGFLLVLVCGGKAKEQRFNLAISTLNRCFA